MGKSAKDEIPQVVLDAINVFDDAMNDTRAAPRVLRVAHRLFTRVHGRGILRTSALRSSRQFTYQALSDGSQIQPP
jgi:hypothetical protein